jgi:hypothetical protein
VFQRERDIFSSEKRPVELVSEQRFGWIRLSWEEAKGRSKQMEGKRNYYRL